MLVQWNSEKNWKKMNLQVLKPISPNNIAGLSISLCNRQIQVSRK